METAFALDFISLLLSKHNARQAEMSMSQFLKGAIPLGTLSAEVINPPPRPDSTLKDIKSVSRGWRLQNFSSAANKLLNAGSRLETEINSETKYWNEVLAVKEKGWKVCRLPREGQALAVQYGFLEGKITLFARRLPTDIDSYAYFPRPRARRFTKDRRRKLVFGQRVDTWKSERSTREGETRQSRRWLLEGVPTARGSRVD